MQFYYDVLLIYAVGFLFLVTLVVVSSMASRNPVDWQRIGMQIVTQSTLLICILLPPLLLTCAIALLFLLATKELTTKNTAHYIHYVAAIIPLLIGFFPVIWLYLILILLLIYVFFPLWRDTMFILLSCAFISALVLIRQEPLGRDWDLLVITVVALTDIGAYAIGKGWKGIHYISRQVSPNKTYEVALAVYPVNLVYCYLFSRLFLPDISLQFICLSTLLITFMAQVGDFLFSWIKRQRHLDDFSKALHHIGGFMDLLDSMILASAAMLLLLKASNWI